MPDQIRVAIVGGSIAGCTLANGLTKYPHIAFDVFDAKSTFRERGAAVGLAVNAENALRAMGMDVDEAFSSAGATRMKSTYCKMGIGEHRGKLILELPGGVNSVTRDRWLTQLLKHLPPESLHANKRLTTITQRRDPHTTYTLHFEDGTTHDADAVIGCDGARSQVREFILGSEKPELLAPIFGGYWDARGRLTPHEAAEKFGNDLVDPMAPDEMALVGDGAFMLFAPSDDGDVFHVIVSALAGPNFDKTSWKTTLSREFLDEAYKDWDDKFRSGVIDALMAEDSGPGVVFSQWQSPEAPTYYRHRVCMIGDAAHSTTPWMGQGAGMATEDASVMAAVLGSAQTREEVTAAFKAFDQLRRGRPEHVVRQSQEAAKLLTGQLGKDPAEVAPLQASKWWTDVWALDMESHIQEAIDLFHKFNKDDKTAP